MRVDRRAIDRGRCYEVIGDQVKTDNETWEKHRKRYGKRDGRRVGAIGERWEGSWRHGDRMMR